MSRNASLLSESPPNSLNINSFSMVAELPAAGKDCEGNIGASSSKTVSSKTSTGSALAFDFFAVALGAFMSGSLGSSTASVG